MANRHLTDTELQDFLDGGGAQSNLTAGLHLSSCDICARRLEQYKSLCTELEVEPDFRLPCDFAERTAAFAMGESPQSKAALSLWRLIPVVGIVTAMVSAWWFLDSSDVFETAANFMRIRMSLDWSFLDDLIAQIHASGGSFTLLLAGALAIVAVWIIDGQVKKARQGTSAIAI